MFFAEAVSSSSIQQCPMNFEVETHNATVTTTSMSTVLFTKTVTITAASCYMTKTNSFTLNSTPDHTMGDQSLQSNGSLTAWMAVTILFIVIAVSAITLSIFVGYFWYKKIMTLEKSLAAFSATNTKELLTQGIKVRLIVTHS